MITRAGRARFTPSGSYAERRRTFTIVASCSLSFWTFTVLDSSDELLSSTSRTVFRTFSSCNKRRVSLLRVSIVSKPLQITSASLFRFLIVRYEPDSAYSLA